MLFQILAPRAVQNSDNQLEMAYTQDASNMEIKLHFGSPKVYLASSLIFEVADFGTKLGAKAAENMALMAERMGGTTDLTQGYSVTEVAPVVDQPKRMKLYLDVDAPLIFVPSCIEEKKGPTIVVDLGRVVVDHDSGAIEGPAPEFMNYKIDMKDLNAFVTEGDSSNVDYEDGAVIKKFDMHFHVGVRNSQNSELPATKLNGKLPEINVFVTKEKLRDILIVASSIKPPESLTSPTEQPAINAATPSTAVVTTTSTKEFVLDAFFAIEKFNLMLRDTSESESEKEKASPQSRRGRALARISFNGLQTKFAMTSEKMNLDVQLQRFRVKDRTSLNKLSPVTKNLVASAKGITKDGNLQFD